MSDAVIKAAAKKVLKKAEGKTMKLKDLTLSVTLAVPGVTDIQVKNLLQRNSKFQLEGKLVSLKRKRSKSSKFENEGELEANTEAHLTKSNAKKVKETKTSAIANECHNNSGSLLWTLESVAQWRQDNKIVVMQSMDIKEMDRTGHNRENNNINEEEAYFPFASFRQCRPIIHEDLIQQCTAKNGFLKPSPIQAQAWPILSHHHQHQREDGGHDRRQRDFVGIAETGSGKTLAFALPALSRMAQKSIGSSPIGRRRLPRMLVLSPTRELAMQSDDVLNEFGAAVGLQSLVLYGGVPKHEQVSQLKGGAVDILVVTPGRVKDLIQEGVCNLSAVDFLVLDEADRMLDMGFEDDVRYIISQCKSREAGRQTAMFSATWPASIQKIALDYMSDPIRVYVGFNAIVGSNGDNGVDDSLSANKRVKQIVEVIEDRERLSRLRQLLCQYQGGKGQENRILVFALYKKEAERLEQTLMNQGFQCCSIHGNKHQASRTSSLAQFKDGRCPIMVATDVAARGLDIPNVEVVINYTFPLTIEDYVHRIGRTGRAGKSGVSVTFFQGTDKSHAGELQQVMRQAGQPIPEELMRFGSTIKKKEHKLYGNFGPRGEPMKVATKIKFDDA